MFVTEQTAGNDLCILREPQLPDSRNCSWEDMAISYFTQFLCNFEQLTRDMKQIFNKIIWF